MDTDIKIPSGNKLPYAREVSIKRRIKNWLDAQQRIFKETKEKKG